MRVHALFSFPFLSLVATLSAGFVYADAPSTGSALYPPGLLNLINRGNALLSAGQYNDAVKAYSEAIELSPADYLLYYKRATAFYSLSRHPQALSDFEQVLSLTNDTFDNANLMKARIYTKEGDFPAARDAIKKYSLKNKTDSTVQEILMSISEAEMASKKAKQAMRAKLWTACAESASTALATASHSIELRQLRVDCSIASTDVEGAVGDLTRLAHLTSPTTSLFMKTFRLAYFLLPHSASTSSAMAALKQCLHYDPDSKECLPAHRLVKSFDKTFKKLEKALNDEKWQEIIDLLTPTSDPNTGFAAKFEEALKTHVTPQNVAFNPKLPLRPPMRTSPKRELILRALCKAYVHQKAFEKGSQWCEELLAMDGLENDVDGLIGRGEAALKNEEWEEAVRIFEKAFESSGRSNREVHQKLQKAQKLLKQSKHKDYYKVLDVSRDADAKTIKKAFRKAAMKAHPDKGGSEAKMAAVNEAYEVLSKPELRQRYDNGDDPNDPTGGQGGNPFAGGGFDFGGSGHPFAQFFQQASGGFPGGGGGFQFHFSQRGH
ncbi:hypothetical protein C8Q75DRAFT_799705 [Abortiporus biennis]|nr:hypothetical protein C8Q75DRAFT_799705 [Abortiporus biennis]